MFKVLRDMNSSFLHDAEEGRAGPSVRPPSGPDPSPLFLKSGPARPKSSDVEAVEDL
jgi:hypothetical protein